MSAAIVEHDVTVLQGDVREQLATMGPRSVQCVVTSPPYYGLRDYGTGQWESGDPDCDHKKKNPEVDARTSTLGPRGEGLAVTNAAYQHGKTYRDVCGKCGARRRDRQIGLEPSPAEYVAEMVAVFAAVRRVLADDGVLWLNIGDSYSGGNRGSYDSAGHLAEGVPTVRPVTDVPAKNLLGIPWRVAFGLQDDGWTLRNAVIWNKPNAMPESVTDRLSTRYEHVFLFSKSRRYTFDLGPIKVAATNLPGGNTPQSLAAYGLRPGTENASRRFGGNPTSTLSTAVETRNPGDVWTIPTSPFPGAHFATMPPELARRCILAGCPDDGTVLDPFAGSGTTLKVARALGRKSVGIELNPAYIEIIRDRIGQTPLDFGGVA